MMLQVYLQDDGVDLYIPRAGRFNVEGYFGWERLDDLIGAAGEERIPDLTHAQVQTLLGAIGAAKGFDIWIPVTDRSQLDWTLTRQFGFRDALPGFDQVEGILREVDVIWLERGSTRLHALFEVEHSTPIYSGLLRFNDIHLTAPDLKASYRIVANDIRRSLFTRQIGRPTFTVSGLGNLCAFLEYVNVLNWHKRIVGLSVF